MKRLFSLLATIVCTLTLSSQGVSFAWQGLSLVYPSNYQITNKEFDGESYSFCCETKNDEISMIFFSLVKKDFLKLLSKEDAIETAKESTEEAVSELRSSYINAIFSETKVDRNHCYTYVYCTFTGYLLSTLINGKIIVMANGDKFVCLILQTENQSYLKELNDIVYSIRLE